MRYIWDEGAETWVPADQYRRPAAGGVNLISDNIDPFRSEADGMYYDSKSAYRKSLRAHGLTEVGNEKLKPAEKKYPGGIKEDLRRAAWELGYYR